jgi:hypothetical protein
MAEWFTPSASNLWQLGGVGSILALGAMLALI